MAMKKAITLALLLAAMCATAQNYGTNNATVQTFAGSGFSGYLDGVGQQTMLPALGLSGEHVVCGGHHADGGESGPLGGRHRWFAGTFNFWLGFSTSQAHCRCRQTNQENL